MEDIAWKQAVLSERLTVSAESCFRLKSEERWISPSRILSKFVSAAILLLWKNINPPASSAAAWRTQIFIRAEWSASIVLPIWKTVVLTKTDLSEIQGEPTGSPFLYHRKLRGINLAVYVVWIQENLRYGGVRCPLFNLWKIAWIGFRRRANRRAYDNLRYGGSFPWALPAF